MERPEGDGPVGAWSHYVGMPDSAPDHVGTDGFELSIEAQRRGRKGRSQQGTPEAPTFESGTNLISEIVELTESPRSPEDLAGELGVTVESLKRPIDDMIQRAMLVRKSDGNLQRASEDASAGYAHRNPKGGLTIMPDDRQIPMLSVERFHDNGALPGDRVLFTWREETLDAQAKRRKGVRPGGNRNIARVISILSERPKEVAGITEILSSGEWIARLWGQNKPRDVRLDNPDKIQLKPGLVVRLELPREYNGRGKLLGVVSSVETPGEDANTVAALYDLRQEFPPEVEAEVAAMPTDPSPDEFVGRLDLREEFTITIDPKDAKDHDDAISIRDLGEGYLQLGVHIADVANYVRQGTALHMEAYSRATSVYLPGKTIPMLPFKLSAGLCSLVEGRDRLAMSCIMVFDDKGREVRRELYKSVIRVDRFLNYEQALAVLEGRLSVGEEADEALKLVRLLADRLKQRRLDSGSIVLSIDRPHLVLGEKGEVVEVQPERSDDSHNLVEECMLAANRAVASFLLERNCPYMGRIHPEPDLEAEEEFAEFCERLGVAAPNFQEPRRVQMFLEGIANREGAHAINLAVLKSMKRATYAAEPGLHYALGFWEYTHFTSPIRRLCDTTVHQIITAYIDAGGSFRWQQAHRPWPWADGSPAETRFKVLDGAAVRGNREMRMAMPAICRQATDREVVASKAEMEVLQLKLMRLLEDSVGAQMQGTVTHISNQGAVVQLEEYWCEGTLFYFDLSDEWITPRKFWAEVPVRDGVMLLRVGDKITVEVAEVNTAARSLRLRLPQKPSERAARSGGKKGKGKFEFRDRRKG